MTLRNIFIQLFYTDTIKLMYTVRIELFKVYVMLCYVIVLRRISDYCYVTAPL